MRLLIVRRKEMKQIIFLLLILQVLNFGCATKKDKSLSGEWTGDWGYVVIKGNKGTYTDTYGTGPGTFEFDKAGEGIYNGIWGESVKRHGTMSFTVSGDSKVISGSSKADDNCKINPGSQGSIHWIRK